MIEKPKHEKTAGQMVRFTLVGVGNTLLTLVVIFTLTDIFRLDYLLANGIGYTCGLIFSFVVNKIFTFRSKEYFLREAVFFIGVCIVCYFVQLGVLVVLREAMNLPVSIAQLLAIGVYTSMNFFLNKFITFKEKG